MKNIIGRIQAKNSLLFFCDIQERFRPLIFGVDSVIQIAKMFAKLSLILQIPLVATEHNSAAFGKTIQECQDCLPTKYSSLYQKFEKQKLSMITTDVQGFMDKHQTRKQAILFGSETHVCVQQTCLELLEQGYQVHLPVDGISSCRELDRSVALHRMRQSGAFLSTSESIIFEMVHNVAECKEFKLILPLLKEQRTFQFPSI